MNDKIMKLDEVYIEIDKATYQEIDDVISVYYVIQSSYITDCFDRIVQDLEIPKADEWFKKQKHHYPKVNAWLIRNLLRDAHDKIEYRQVSIKKVIAKSKLDGYYPKKWIYTILKNMKAKLDINYDTAILTIRCSTNSILSTGEFTLPGVGKFKLNSKFRKKLATYNGIDIPRIYCRLHRKKHKGKMRLYLKCGVLYSYNQFYTDDGFIKLKGLK